MNIYLKLLAIVIINILFLYIPIAFPYRNFDNAITYQFWFNSVLLFYFFLPSKKIINEITV